MSKKRLFAIYLPQFHPIPENDKFWGKGFTEWHNVTTGTPQYPGHYQPHIPSELGFYDLRLEETLAEQSILAKQHGIDGFLFYHYWFNGKPVMNRPLQNYLKMTQHKLPYFFCWANENWTRRWDGGEQDVLLNQDYSQSEAEKHLAYLAEYFTDEQYLKINGCPVLVIYKPFLIPELEKWIVKFREISLKHGFPGIYLIYMVHQGHDKNPDVKSLGFNAGLKFEPSYDILPLTKYSLTIGDKVGKLRHLLRLKKDLPLIYRHSRIDYNDYINYRMSRDWEKSSVPVFPMVFPSWDNTCRRKKGGGTIFSDSNPQSFGKWLDYAVNQVPAFSKEEDLVIINAWNEWAEGNHLEPCVKWERQYLEAVREVVQPDNN
jgi:hypothetical protein